MTGTRGFDAVAVRGALDEILAGRAERRTVAALTGRRSPYSSSFPVEELDVTLDDGTSLALVMKNLSRDAMLPTARRTRPRMLDDPDREIETYRTILAAHVPGTAPYLGAVVDRARHRFWLFLQRAPGFQLCDVGDFTAWQRAARWAGALHATPWRNGMVDTLAQAQHLVRYDRAFLDWWGERAEHKLLHDGHPAAEVRALVRSHGRAAELLAAQPATFIHGEFYAANIVVSPDGEGEPRLCVVDWELAAIGPGLIDLAALTAGDWSAERRAQLVEAYDQGLAGAGGSGVDGSERVALLSACRLHLALRWLGWARRWTPPRRHAQDWWAEARAAAAVLSAVG